MYIKIFFIVLFFAYSFSGLSQKTDNLNYKPNVNSKVDLKTIPKGTWKIIIKTTTNKESSFQYIGEQLISENFQIGNLSEDFYTISTVPKAHERLGFNYILNFVAMDSAIVVTGTFKINASVDLGIIESNFDNERIENKGQTGSPIREAFRKMIEFTMKFAELETMEFIFN